MSNDDYIAGQVFMQHRVLNALEKQYKQLRYAQDRLQSTINAFTNKTPTNIKLSCQSQMRSVIARMMMVEKMIATIRRLRRQAKAKGATR